MGLTKYILENSKKIVIPYNSAPFFLFVGSFLSLSLSPDHKVQSIKIL